MVEALIYGKEIKYHAIKLSKELHTRELEGKEVLSLKRAHGVEPIPDPSAPDGPQSDPIHAEFNPNSIFSKYNALSEHPTHCDILIYVTMYNEGIKEFTDTLSGIIDNMESFLDAGVNLKNIICVVMVDGMKAFKKTLNTYKSFFENYFLEDKVLEMFKVDDILNCKIKGGTDHDELCHCFEQTLKYQNNPKVLLKFMFCVKQVNKRKLNSHLWLFGGFCPHIQPTFVMMIDVGTVPGRNSLFYLYEAMATDHRIAGCTGEISPLEPSLFKILVGYQVIEYKLASIFERTVESVAGFITYLPSTFCAYRWEALQGEPLWSNYFKSIMYPEKLNLVNANIYLAGDRLLCFSVFTQKHSKYLLRFVKNATAETDVPEEFDILLAQRRRWINGAFFGIYYIFKNYKKLVSAEHHWFRKVIYNAQIIYILLSVLNNWVIVSSLYLFNAISIRTMLGLNRSSIYNVGNIVIQIYFFLLLMIFIMSYGTKPERIKNYLKFITIFFSIYIFAAIITTLVTMNLTSYPMWVVYAFVAVIGCFIVGSLLNSSLFTLLKYMLHYIMAYPTFINVLNIYAVCNIHEVTWGSRPDFPTPEERKRVDEYEHHRSRWVIIWVVCNIGYYALVMSTSSDTGMYYLYVTMAIITIIYSVKFVGSIIYLLQELFCRRHLNKVKNIEAITLNRSKSIKLHKKNKKLLEKSFQVQSKKNKKVVPELSIPVPTEAEHSERKTESTRNEITKNSQSSIAPLHALRGDKSVVNEKKERTDKKNKGKQKEKEKMTEKGKKVKEGKTEKKEKKDKKNKKGKKKNKETFKFFPNEEVKNKKDSGDVSEILNFDEIEVENEIIPIKGKMSESEKEEHSDLIELGKSIENYFDFNSSKVQKSISNSINPNRSNVSPEFIPTNPFSNKYTAPYKPESEKSLDITNKINSKPQYTLSNHNSNQVIPKFIENNPETSTNLKEIQMNLSEAKPSNALLNPELEKNLKLKELEDDIFKDDINENGSFKAPGNEFDEFLLGLKEDSGFVELKDFSIDLKPIKDFNPSKTIKQDSEKVSVELDELSDFEIEKPEIDLFAPGVMSNERYKIGIPIKRLATLSGLDVMRVREIEKGKQPEADEAEKIKLVFKQLTTN